MTKLAKRGANLQVRLRAQEYRTFKRRARADGLAVSAWARMVLLRQLKRTPHIRKQDASQKE